MSGRADSAGRGAARFPRRQRLSRPAEFKRVFSATCRSRDSRFVVLAVLNKDDSASAARAAPGPARLGLVVAKKSAPRAVDRNRLKRLARESFRRHSPALAGLDIVALAQKGAVTSDNSEIRASLSRHWKKILRCKNLLSA